MSTNDTVHRLSAAFLVCVALGLAGPPVNAQGTLEINQD